VSAFRASQASNATRLVVLDGNIPNASSLAASVLPGSAVITLDPRSNGIRQISQALANRRNLTSLHIVSRGRDGTLVLGNTTLTTTNLGQFSSAIQQWGRSLSGRANVFLYGSRVAESSAGQAFVRRLGGLVRRTVAASTDQSGSVRGGDWEMEYRTGAIASGLAFNPSRLAAYRNTLDLGAGLRAEYFDNADFTGFRYQRIDPKINANWGNGAPAGLAPNTFSIRWTGQIEAPTSDTYTFFLNANDGARLFINGRQIISRSGNPALGEQKAQFFLRAGQRYDIRLEYSDNTGSASINLAWANRTQARQAIAPMWLFPAAPVDETAPTAQLSAPTLATSSNTPYSFSVTYGDNIGINAGTIDSRDIRVTGPNGFSQLAQLVSVNPAGNGSPLTAIYQLTAPDQIWNWNERGIYTVTLLAGAVQDTRNNTTTTDIRLGSFQVAVDSTILLDTDRLQVQEGRNVILPIRRTGDLTGTATINYYTRSDATVSPKVNFVPIPLSTLTFAPGETQKEITVQTLDDRVAGTNGSVNVVLEQPTGADLGLPQTAAIAILDRPVAPPPSGLSFGPVTRYSTSTSAHGVDAADLNGDGRIDLAVANAGTSTVSVLLGRGNGTFTTTVNYRVGIEPKSVFAADLNGDGFRDLFSANQNGDNVTVLLNRGDGTFATGVDYASLRGAHEAVAGDVDGDGDLDIAVVGWGGPIAVVLRNNGDGTFGGRVVYSVGDAPHSLQLADFNGDGRPDLATANRGSSNISVLLNNGTGLFGTPVTYGSGVGPHSMRAADLNGDGRIDLVTVNDFSDNVSVLLGNGSGGFTTVNYATGSVPKGVAIGDVNGDGRLDILTANTAGNYPNFDNPGGNTISVLLGRGDGTFGTASTFVTGRTPFSLTVADFNGDARLDVATANWHTSDVGVLLNNA
jgi:hypothetical protein